MRRARFLLIMMGIAACRRHGETPASLLLRMPTQEATVVSIDVETLRRAGILKLFAASKTVEEPEYQAFIRNSGFDYQRDLDSALVAFAPSGTFFLISGRFDWKKLESYAQSNGGSCYDRLCRMPGSTLERRISFLPIDSGLMALAVSGDDLAAARLTKPGPQRAIDVPAEPVWMSIPGASLRKADFFPEGTRAFASALTGAGEVMLTLGPRDDRYEARLEAACQSPEDARALGGRLTKLTTLLRGAVKPGAADDLPALLAAGLFQEKDRKVFGYWPVRKGLLDNLAGGS